MGQLISTLCLLAVLLPGSVYAQNWYQVELIIFRNTSSSAGNTEVWPLLETLPALEKAVELTPQATTGKIAPLPFQKIDPTNYRLQGAWDVLTRSGRYEPLLHTGWLQPALERDKAQSVRIQQGKPLADAQPEPAAVFADSVNRPTPGNTQSATRNTDIDSSLPVPTRPLDGTATVIAGFYLFLQLDLLYLPEGVAPLSSAEDAERIPDVAAAAERNRVAILAALARGDISLERAEQLVQQPETKNEAGAALLGTFGTAGLQGYRLNQNRRIRLDEIHYFDHPMFGVIAIITPYKLSEPQDTP